MVLEILFRYLLIPTWFLLGVMPLKQKMLAAIKLLLPCNAIIIIRLLILMQFYNLRIVYFAKLFFTRFDKRLEKLRRELSFQNIK